MKNTIYLLTGAAGLLGSNVCRALLAQGKTVRALVLPGDPAACYVPQAAEQFQGDVTDLASLERFFSVPAGNDTVVIHCASIVTMSPEPSQKVYDVNVTGAKNIVDLCVSHGVRKLVYISSTGAIPEPEQGTAITEPSAFDPEGVVGYYSKTKALATMYVLDAAKNRGLDASVIYPSGICGPNDYAFGPVAGVILKYCSGGMPVGVEGTFNSVDVRDLADGVLACVEKGRPGEGYIMSNQLVTLKEMFTLVSAASGAPLVKQFLPVEVMRDMLKNKLPDGPDKERQLSAFDFSMYNLVRNNNFSCDKARQELGYRTRPFDETIRDEVAWLTRIGKVARRSA